jgi:hypothetical protein
MKELQIARCLMTRRRASYPFSFTEERKRYRHPWQLTTSFERCSYERQRVDVRSADGRIVAFLARGDDGHARES